MEPPGKAETRELHLRELPAFHAALVAALAEAGQSGAQLHEVFETRVRGECLRCGSPASGAELAHATALGVGGAELTPRVARLAQGYCGRKDCASYFYRLTFAPTEGVDWARMLERADALGALRARVEKLEQDAQGTARTAAGRQRVLLVAGALAALLSVWVVKRLLSGQPLPGFEAKPKYQVDPSSLPPPPGSIR